MSISEAKRELYQELKKKKIPVIGAGVKEKQGTEVIVIFLDKAFGKSRSTIPSTYKGNKVVTELSSIAKAV